MKKEEVQNAYESIKKAIETINEGTSYMGPKTLTFSNIYLIYGQILFKMDSLKQSEKMLLDCYNMSKKNKFYTNVGIAAQQLSLLYETQGNLPLSLKYLKTSIEYSNISQNDEKLNKLAKKELDYRNKELATFVLYLMKKNELVMETSKKLKRMRLVDESNKRILFEIISSLDTDSATDLGEEFDMRFKEVHTGFYKNLSKEFPTLTTNELRLCSFLRLNMNTKDISAITFQSPNSITVARYRLRTKLGLRSSDSLAGFLSKY